MTVKMLTYIADVSSIVESEILLPEDCRLERISDVQSAQLAKLHFAAYGPNVVNNEESSYREMVEMFSGEFGELWPEASPLFFAEKGLVAAVLTVHEAPWNDTPKCPFIIDVMVDVNFRRNGLATYLIQEVARTVKGNRKSYLALRVNDDNTPALSLYRKLGFTNWDGKLCPRK